MGDWEIISNEEVDELRRMVEDTGVQNLPNYISKKAKQWQEVEVHIAVLGETYVGKSTFINQLRRVEEWDDTFAPVGLGDTTLEPTAYENPYNKNMVFWDLPGVGTLKFSKDESYFRTINIERYDFFIIMSDQCFSENDAWLAREIRKRGKPFFFVRSKLDEDFKSAEHDGQSIDKAVPRIYKSCADNLRKANFREPNIFIISNYNHEIGQFDDLMIAIFHSLPDLKKEAMILSIGPLTHNIIREKKKTLHSRVFKIAVISAGVAAIPVPGLDVIADLAIIAHEIHFYMSEFGLDEESLKHLCKKTKTKYDQITESLKHSKSLLTEKNIIRTLFMKIVKTQAAEQVAGRFAKYIPIIGSIVSSGVAYGACVKFLRSEIDLLEQDAHTLIDVVIDKNKKL
ncbi:interferon-inducible GTPase 5-like [Mytilus californianus]|uniref:interferon-inducible GTPase 5-like n=1 Tax=Mytilus californianus TaxID=6549 RepID=UPI002246C662|nr:interferon-inducible GTPase 5-like [Mytilus californianus]XP_052105422.1 interferon-inducible GTPase 5-like [Mytilus californianus]